MTRRPKPHRVWPEYSYYGWFIQQVADDLFLILDEEHKEIGKASTLKDAEAWIDFEQTGDHSQ